jgi:predicted membrane protein
MVLVYKIFLTKQGNTSIIEAPFLWSGCGGVVYGAGHKAKRLVLQCINGASSNPIEGRTKICQLKNLILTVWFNWTISIKSD